MLTVLPVAASLLSDAERELITFCELSGGTQAEAAKKLGISQGNVSRRLANARHHLGRIIIGALVKMGFDWTELPE